MRATGPCLGWAGVRDQLEALASRQREGGWQGLAVLATTPDWAAAAPSGCERPGTRARNRAAAPRGAPRLSAAGHRRARRRPRGRRRPALLERVERAEPPRVHQPAAHDLRPRRSEPRARHLRRAHPRPDQALGEAPGDQQIVLGETAGYLKSTRYATSVPDFINGLPQDVVCASTVWSQHAYIGGEDPVEATAQALAARGCPQPHTMWITETGVGAAPKDLSAADAITDARRAARHSTTGSCSGSTTPA